MALGGFSPPSFVYPFLGRGSRRSFVAVFFRAAQLEAHYYARSAISRPIRSVDATTMSLIDFNSHPKITCNQSSTLGRGYQSESRVFLVS